uniref:Major facilitator superfamily (MFS) profile domain-containing protein n=1 Tax=Haptolina brevifila TaxID=156173 RepID=A0A7S2GG42_9EUKA|mmetsp:Transcript_36790/g.73325  ORF Transcript_36790/g.73325 Transcript_36790/m.73325 type:complete len:423 (+) Transcript_36790:51-1319(+)
MAIDDTAWLLFAAGLANQMGRVMIPAIKTSVQSDAVMGAEFKDKVGYFLSLVSIVCLGGKVLGGMVTDRLGGWLVLISVFAIWIVSTIGSILSPSVDVFGYAWLLNSFAYTITWGAVVQVIGATYDEAGKSANLAFCASASRFGATIGNITFGQLLLAGLNWRDVMKPILMVQVLLLVLCIFKWSAGKKEPGAAAATTGKKGADAASKPAAEEPGPSMMAAFVDPDFYLMLIPKTVTFTFTQFFMNYIPQLLKEAYGYDDGTAATLGGVAQGGSVVGLLYVGAFYKKLNGEQKVRLVFLELLLCAVVPYALSLGPDTLGRIAVVPLLVVWGVAYALPFYIPPGEFAMQVGGKKGTALFTNVFDAAGFAMSATWNPWASGLAKSGNFETVLLSQAAFGLLSLLTMPLCMLRQNAKAAAGKKKQ